MEGQVSGFRKFLGTRAGKWTIAAIIIFVLYLIGNNSLDETKEKINANQTATQNQNANSSTLVQHKVIPGEVQGTTRRVTVIVGSSITESETIALNESIINQYKSSLTHFNVDYFDDESVSKDYFQKVVSASETEADAMFGHYKATYVFNSTSGLNQLQFNVNGDWKTIKNY